MTGVLVGLAVLCCVIQKGNCARAMGDGVREGARTLLQMGPGLFIMLVAMGCLRASGLAQDAARALSPFLSWMGIPSGALPLVFLRPLSGAGSLAMAGELMAAFGVDSPEALSGAVLCASGDTVFYVLAVYASAAGVVKTRYTVAAALIGWLCGCMAAGVLWPLAL